MRIKKTIMFLLLAVLLIFTAACGKKAEANKEKTNVQFFKDHSMALMIPRSFERLATQADCDAYAKKKGYREIKLDNKNNQLVFYLTEAQHSTLIKEVASDIDKNIRRIPNAGGPYANITAIDHNKEFTEFQVTVKDKKLTTEDKKLYDFLITYGQRYNVYCGTTNKKIHVIFTDSKGNVIEEKTSE